MSIALHYNRQTWAQTAQGDTYDSRSLRPSKCGSNTFSKRQMVKELEAQGFHTNSGIGGAGILTVGDIFGLR